jgi:hypothetical protein
METLPVRGDACPRQRETTRQQPTSSSTGGGLSSGKVAGSILPFLSLLLLATLDFFPILASVSVVLNETNLTAVA